MAAGLWTSLMLVVAMVTRVEKVEGEWPLVLQMFCCWLLVVVLQRPRLLRV